MAAAVGASRAARATRAARPTSRAARRTPPARVAAAATAEPTSVLADDKPQKFSFIVANADFMLNDENSEHFPELLREKRRHFIETDQPIDFWIVEQPAFVDSLGEVSKRVSRPCVALVSTDPVWIRFMKIRMDRVLMGELEGTPSEVLKSNGEIEPFTAPKTWDAPYRKYSHGWWHMFRP